MNDETMQTKPGDPDHFFETTMRRLLDNAGRDLARAQANGETQTAVKARVRLDTLQAALEVHRASPKVAARTAQR
ncbi:hypothetical protein [Deinococcus sp.]|uniref:hypothetical protein n=1 Tax=Deinococcus sp. TaxID=47478 RepID=UPI0025FDC3AD|nr:hypothetical protein [Deinococcus sp.]